MFCKDLGPIIDRQSEPYKLEMYLGMLVYSCTINNRQCSGILVYCEMLSRDRRYQFGEVVD